MVLCNEKECSERSRRACAAVRLTAASWCCNINRSVPITRMFAKTRRIISLLLSLLLVPGSPAMAMSAATGVRTDTAGADCGLAMVRMVDLTDHVASSPNTSATGDRCRATPDVPCPSTSSLSACSASTGFLLTNPTNPADTRFQPVMFPEDPEGSYQNPFLAATTPPPQPRS